MKPSLRFTTVLFAVLTHTTCAALATASAASCGAHRDVGKCYRTGVKLLVKTNTTTADACCSSCAKKQGCQSWVFNPAPKGENLACHLKSGVPRNLDNATPCRGTSGYMAAPPKPLPTPAPAPAPKGAPHILFLFVDEMDGRTLDPAHPQLKPPLPNIEKLIASGVQFTTVYSESPQCVPSRSSLMTGRRTDQIKVWDNFRGVAAAGGNAGNASKLDGHCVATLGADACAAVAAEQTGVFKDGTFLDRLRNHGYNVTLYGKMHVGAGLDEFPGKIYAWAFGNSGSKMAKELARPLGATIGMKGAKQNANNSWTVPDDKPRPATNNDYSTIDACVAALEGGLLGTGKDAVPQFLYCSILVPHPPYASNSTYMANVHALNFSYPEQVPMSQLHPNDLFTVTTKHSLDADEAARKNPENVAHFRRVYFSMITEADALLGKVLDALDATPGAPRDQTFVIFISDHGEDAVEHRQNGKNNMYDSASRVPMVLSGPGIAPSSDAITRLVSLNDVYPTVMAMAKVPPPPDAQLAGHSVLDLVPSWQDAVLGPARTRAALAARPDFVVAQYHSVFSVTGQFMLRQGSWKLIVYGDMPEYEDNFPPQLFDLSTDPWEVHDVAHANPDRVKAMTALLDGYMDWRAADADCKDFDRRWFKTYVFDAKGGSKTCRATMQGLFGEEFNATDAERTARWMGAPCE